MTCEQCAYMIQNKEEVFCRRRAPQIVVMPIKSKLSGQMGAQIVGTYPPVNPTMPACGDFSMRIMPPPTTQN